MNTGGYTNLDSPTEISRPTTSFDRKKDVLKVVPNYRWVYTFIRVVNQAK